MWKRILVIVLTVCALVFTVGVEIIFDIDLGIPLRLGIALPFAIAAGLLTVWAGNE